MQPSVSNRLEIAIYDHDTASTNDDLVGSFTFNWDQIARGDYKDYFWANVYGAQPRITNKEA